MKNYYEILELDTTASQAEVKAAYFKLCKQIKEKERIKEDFFALLTAYTTLSNDEKRAAYDANLKLGDPSCFYKKEEAAEEEEILEEFVAEPIEDSRSKYPAVLP